MPTIQRERYRAALAALETARQQARRAEIMAHIALNRVRQAEEEGFDAEAARREQRRETLVDEATHDQVHVADLAGRAEEQRVLAFGEEIDEVAGDYDAALLAVLAEVERLATAIAAAGALAERAEALAATLPERAALPRHIAAAAIEQIRALRRESDRLETAARETPLPHRSPPSPGRA